MNSGELFNFQFVLLNTYIDFIKYVKNISIKEKKENILFFMVTALIVSQQSEGGSPALVPLATTT